MRADGFVLGGAMQGWIRMRWEKPLRYYEAHLQQDLWGYWVLTCIWGRIGTALGRVVNVPCASYQEGLDKLSTVAKRRARHGYAVVLNSRSQSRQIQ